MIQNISQIRLSALALCATTLLLLTACGGGQSSQNSDEAAQGGTTASGQSSGQKYPDVREAELESSGGDTWSLSVTISSPYDSPERYADGWRVLSPNDEVLGKHELMHDHASEQPFTRSQTGLEIPQDVQKITVEGRDLKNGYGGKTVSISVPRG
ncbi:hypothetical protein BH24ACT22_BH24ACT22_20130 [soil metagenome]